MSLEGYKPLDLSSLQINPAQFQLQAPVPQADIAKQILAGTNWNLTPVESLGANGKATPHKKSFVSRLMDALSVGNYSVSNVLLEGLKAHQSSNNDSVLTDLTKTISPEVGAKGLLEGITASLKGTFGNDATANDPTGKNHFGDVYLHATDKGRRALDPNSNMSLDERKSILKSAYLSGIPADIIADPLNLVGGGEVKGAARAAEAGKIADQAVTKAEQIARLSDSLKNESAIKKLTDLPTDTKLNATPHTPPVEPNNFDPETFDFITSTSRLPNEVDNLSHIRPKSPIGVNAPAIELPAASGRLAKGRGRRSIAGVMLQNIVRGDDWSAVSNKLQQSFPGLNLEKTHGYLDQLSKNPRALQGIKNVPANRVQFIDAIDRLLKHDYEHAGRQLESLRLPDLNTAAHTNEALNASKIVDAITGGSRVAAEAVRPSEVAPVVASSKLDTAVLNHVLNHYGPQIRTGIFEGARNPEHLQQALDSGKTVKWSGPKQVNMWQTILNRIPFAGIKKYQKAHQILKAAEQSFIDAGHTPYSAAKSAESVPLRLSDVIEKIGVENFVKHPDQATTLLRSALAGGEMSYAARKAATEIPDLANTVNNAVEATKAGNAIAETGAVREGLDAGSTEATLANNATNSEARVAQDVNLASKTAKDIAKLSGASHRGGQIAGDLVKQMFLKSDPIENAIGRSTMNTKTALATGQLGKFSNVRTVTNAIHDTIGGPTPTVLGRAIGPGAGTIDWLGARFNTAYKNADMRPIYLAEAATARASVAKRAAVWNSAVKQFGRDPELWGRAFKTAQGHYHPPVGSPEQQLSKLILQNMENLFGSSGLRNGAELDNTVAGRAQLIMDELNANLKRYGLGSFKFTKGAVKDATGATRDFSKGTDWLKSWETWQISEPASFMMRITNAVENTVREANMFNEIASRWGGVKQAGRATAVTHPRLIGSFFEPETAAQIQQFIHNLHDIKQPNSKFLRLVDNVLSKWKSSVTIYMPSHHIRNMVGDTYMNWLAGVNSPKAYSTALKVMRAQKGRYASIEDLGKLTSPNAIMEAIQRAATGAAGGEKGTNIALTMKDGRRVTNDMVYTAAFQNGLLPGARVLEDIADDGLAIDKFRPLGGKGQAAFQHLAEYREHSIRLAHFVDVLKKSNKPFSEAIKDASAAVRKWHPDGMDLTKFERNVMRRVFPFYSWTRKALPVMIESLVMAPGKVLVYPKLMGGLSEGLTGGHGTSDPFPEDQLFPQWLRDKGIGPVLGTSGNYSIVNPSNPTLDLANTFGSPAKGIGSMLNPALRIPAEELTGTEMGTGAPITSQADYLTKQIPGVSIAARVSNISLGGPTKKYQQQGGFNNAAFWNLMLALGLTNTSGYQKQAQFEEKNYLKGH